MVHAVASYAILLTVYISTKHLLLAIIVAELVGVARELFGNWCWQDLIWNQVGIISACIFVSMYERILKLCGQWLL